MKRKAVTDNAANQAINDLRREIEANKAEIKSLKAELKSVHGENGITFNWPVVDGSDLAAQIKRLQQQTGDSVHQFLVAQNGILAIYDVQSVYLGEYVP